MFVDSVLRSDRSVVELLTADYTYLNERLAMHYGIETVKGARFRRVTLPDESRYGLLGKGAVLMLTAYPNRTSPVLRGAWIQERLLGSPPAAAAGRRAGPHRQQARRAAAHAARAARAAPRESDLLRLPRRHGSARLRARELQRGRSVPHARPGHAHADRRERHAAGRHGRQQRRGLAQGARCASRTSSCKR